MDFDPKYRQIVDALGGESNKDQTTFYRWDFQYNGYSCFIKKEHGKYEIHVCAPKCNSDAFNRNAWNAWGELTTSIGVGQQKTVEKIVSDIKRRLDFTAFDRVKALFKEADDHYDQMVARHKAIVDNIVKRTNLKPRENGILRTTIHIGISRGYYGEILVHQCQVDFSIKSVSGESDQKLVNALCDLLREE